MNIYLIPIKYALLIFPFLAALITIPYIIRQYHKYGSIHKLRVLIVYSFVLYMLTVFFLVIMPLPSRSSVANLNMAKYQLKLFDSVTNLWYTIKLNHLNFLNILKNPIFYTTAYNILLTIPFGIYLRYYFKCGFIKTTILSFLLSLFLEITQLTGIFFIYPRNYRLFDVDDLFFNTLGGIIGFLIAPIFMKFLPSRDEIDNSSYLMGEKVSFLRRTMAFTIDFSIFIIIFTIFYITKFQGISNILSSLKVRYLFLITYSFYYLILPTIFKGHTLGKSMVSIKITTQKSPKYLRFKIFMRNLILYFIILASPIYLALIHHHFHLDIVVLLSIAIIIFIIYLLIIILLISGNYLLYERLTDTQNLSTITYNLQPDLHIEEKYDNIMPKKGEL